MSQKYIKTKLVKKQYKQLTYEQRIQLFTLKNELDDNNKAKYNIIQLTDKLNVHKSTFSRGVKI